MKKKTPAKTTAGFKSTPFSPETNQYHTDPILKIIGIDWHLMIIIIYI